MKTLKEILEEFGTEGYQSIRVKNAVKEWLTQKRQEIADKSMIKTEKIKQLDVINELIEELQEE